MRPIFAGAAAAVLATASMVFACSSRDVDSDAGSIDAERLVNTRWVLLDISGIPALPGYEATLEFTLPDRFGGTTGCNHFGGKFDTDGSRLRFSETMQTLIGCPPPILEQESLYTEALTKVEHFSFVGDELRLEVDGSDAPLRFLPRRAAPDASAASPTSPAAGAWTPLPPLGSGSRQETAVVALEGEVVVLGGFNGQGQVSALVEAYSPATKSWRRLPDLPVAMHHANAAVVGRTIYVVGFLTGANFVPDSRIFSLTAGSPVWEQIGTMPGGKHRGASGVGVINGKIYLAGGLRSGSVADFSRWDPSTGVWEDLPAVPERRDHAAAGVIDGKFVLAGGRSGAITSLTGRVDIFDPVTGEWSTGAPMPTARGGTAAAVLGGKLYVFGGEGNAAAGSGVFPDTEAYDLASNTWHRLEPMATPRHGTGAAALEGVIYVPGGATRQAFGAVATADVFVPAE